MSISVGVLVSVDSGRDLCWIASIGHTSRKIHLERERNERVGQREHEISRYGGTPSPNHELVELKSRVAFIRLEVFEVNWQVEGEREE